MDGKPVTPTERAYARTEVAGLDELPGDPTWTDERRDAVQPPIAPPAEPPRVLERRGVQPVGLSAGHGPLSGERLDPAGERWLKTLPVTVRPVITAKRHPHIVNKFARIWDRPSVLAAYMNELLLSSRPGRRGFAMEVLDELVLLQRMLEEQRRN